MIPPGEQQPRLQRTAGACLVLSSKILQIKYRPLGREGDWLVQRGIVKIGQAALFAKTLGLFKTCSSLLACAHPHPKERLQQS